MLDDVDAPVLVAGPALELDVVAALAAPVVAPVDALVVPAPVVELLVVAADVVAALVAAVADVVADVVVAAELEVVITGSQTPASQTPVGHAVPVAGPQTPSDGAPWAMVHA